MTKKLSDSERRNIELRALYNFKGVSNVSEPRNTQPLDADKTHEETRKILKMRGPGHRHNEQHMPLQDLFDAERAAREKPVALPQPEPSLAEVHERTRATLQSVENLRKMETREAMEKADKQLAESKKVLQTLGHWDKHGPGTLEELERQHSKEKSDEQQKAFQKAIRQITEG